MGRGEGKRKGKLVIIDAFKSVERKNFLFFEFAAENKIQHINSVVFEKESLIPLDILVRVEILLSESSVGDGRSWIHGWNENRSINEVTRAR